MRYSYSAAWSVVGGISLPSEYETIELGNSTTCRFILTRNPDSVLEKVERGIAIGQLMLKGIVGLSTEPEFNVALESELTEIRAERRRKSGSFPVLAIEARGDIDATLGEFPVDRGEYIVTFDALNKQAIRRAHRSEIDAIQLAVSLESELPSRFSFLNEGTYLIDETGKLVYSMSLSMNADLVVSKGLSIEEYNRVSARYAMLQQSSEFTTIQRLFAEMADFGAGRLKAFLSGWTALEILIAKAFNTYEEEFLSPLKSAGQPTLRDRFLDRVKVVMSDKYRLTDKFAVVAAVLFPTALDEVLNEVYKKFQALKELRDKILHGREYQENELPVHDLAPLLRKYIIAHLEMGAAPPE